jgi:hypothetical protein
MNSRRFIALPPEAHDEAPYQVELAMSALGQKPPSAPQKAMSSALAHVRQVPSLKPPLWTTIMFPR